MKKMVIGTLVMFSVASTAMAQSRAVDIVKGLRKLNGSVGRVVESYENGIAGSRCAINIQDEDFEMGGERIVGMTVSLNDTGMYFTPNAMITNSAKLVDDNTLLVSESSKRAGGDACGDMGGAVGFKETISLEGKKVTIRQQFRCISDGLRKTDLKTTCQF